MMCVRAQLVCVCVFAVAWSVKIVTEKNMGGHGHGPPYKIPDPSIYKVEDVPELKALQEKLAKQGLRDPWLRNYVWRIPPPESSFIVCARVVLRGCKVAVPAFLLTIAVEQYLGIDYHHGHGSHGHDSGHGHH